MTFVHPLLLWGAALVAVPIVLHLVIRRRPRRVEFPALQLVRQRHEASRRRLRLRHLLLLALRIAAIALVAMALARPSVQLSGSLGSREAPVAAALVFDAAPRMEYRHENRTRLAVAGELGRWLLGQLPDESQIAVLDTRLGAQPGARPTAAFQVDRSAAAQRIEQLAPAANSQSLPAALDEAFRLLEESDLARKEVYVFTDLARAAWPASSAAALQQRAAKLPGASIYVIDVGVPDPTDYALGELRLSAQTISSRSSLAIGTELLRLGPSGERTVDLFLLDEAGEAQKRGQQTVQVAPGGSAELGFQLGGLAEGTHQGYVQIAGADSLAADDIRYFSVDVKRPWPILLVDPKSIHTHVGFLSEMLAPEDWRKGGLARFECEMIAQRDLAKTDLDAFAAVCLVDPKPLSGAEWDKLARYVSAGGGLAVFLGRNAHPVTSFNSVEAAQLLPGPLVRQVPTPETAPFHLAPRGLQHPMLAALRQVRGSIPWSDMPVYRYWELGKLAEGVGVVVRFSDGRPALVERTVGEGRVVAWTTPISDVDRGKPWNLLPQTDPWPLLILTNQMMLYLVGGADERLNYYAGQTATLTTGEAARYRSYVVTAPGGLTFPLAADPRRKELAITSTDEPGNYRVRAGGTSGADYGFSVNLAPRQTELERLTRDELAERFGPVRFQLARNRGEIERNVSMARVGRELFPLLILLAAAALAVEHVLANRFYRE